MLKQNVQNFSSALLSRAISRCFSTAGAAGETAGHHQITNLASRAVIRIEGDQGPQFLQVSVHMV